MRARIQAVFILFSIISLPVLGYWYFYDEKITSLIFDNTGEYPYTVELRWALSYKYFPILDKAIYYKSTCKDACIFRPIPPIPYDINITSPWMEMISDKKTLMRGSADTYKIVFMPALILTPLGQYLREDTQNISIGTSQAGEDIRMEKSATGMIWFFLSWSEVPFFSTHATIASVQIDRTHSSLIIDTMTREKYIVDIYTGESMLYDRGDDILSAVMSYSWKIRTNNELYEHTGDTWQKNMRFTDYIDISPRWRIGYIDAWDTPIHAVQNISPQESLLILLDRKTGVQKILKKGTQISDLFFYLWKPAYRDVDGEVGLVEFDFTILE